MFHLSPLVSITYWFKGIFSSLSIIQTQKKVHIKSWCDQKVSKQDLWLKTWHKHQNPQKVKHDMTSTHPKSIHYINEMTKTYLTTAIIKKTWRDPNRSLKYWWLNIKHWTETRCRKKYFYQHRSLKTPNSKLQNKKMKITVLLLLSDT